MAGVDQKGQFVEKVSPYLQRKMDEYAAAYGVDSPEYKALALQYKKSDKEKELHAEDNKRHWQADLMEHVFGPERLYHKSMVIEPTMICAAHCRYCLRGNYSLFTLNEEQLDSIAKYAGSPEVKNDLNEVLITGGDPLIVPKRLHYLVDSLIEHAPNIKIIRIATRLLTHDPERLSNNVFEIFRNKPGIRFELATQINHAAEFFPETERAITKFRNLGVKLYSQNIVLKGINDDANSLISLYLKMRECDIEPHYLFHCVPMQGMHHFRTTVAKGLRLIKEIVNSGELSGRIKPMYAIMSDIGKITLYEGTILEKDEASNRILIQSSYKYDDRMRWNPSWQLPERAEVDENGYIRVWYLDGQD